VGVGRIGKNVIDLLRPFNPNIIACDINPDIDYGKSHNLVWVDKEEIFRKSDIVSIHIPGNKRNLNYLDRQTIASMKTGSYIINTSRGAILDEMALFDALSQKHLAGAALDVFKEEPYEGNLAKLDNVILTAHIAASATGARYLMELGAVEDCIRVLKGQEPKISAFTQENLEGE
jgi:D-3-phosphoglycerate dehydrogenase